MRLALRDDIDIDDLKRAMHTHNVRSSNTVVVTDAYLLFGVQPYIGTLVMFKAAD